MFYILLSCIIKCIIKIKEVRENIWHLVIG